MRSTVACDECGTLVPLEKAYHRKVRGFLCEKCQEKVRSGQWAIFALMLFVVVVFSVGNSQSYREKPRTSVGLSSETIAGNGHPGTRYSVSLSMAEGLTTDADLFEEDWQERVPEVLLRELRTSSRWVNNLAFDLEEALALPGALIESTNQSIIVHLRAPDGEQEFELVAESDDFGIAFPDDWSTWLDDTTKFGSEETEVGVADRKISERK